MGNAAAAGTVAAAAAQAGDAKTAALLEHASSSKSWAVTDHSLSAPWGFLVKEEVQCLCEGGRACSREDPARQRPGPNAVPGLHSCWVGDSVLAMARPWQEHVVKHDLPTRFRALNIGCILNLQEVGEHDSCGPGTLPASGFSYDPEAFMAAGVAVYNLAWRDMGVPSLDKMMDVVQVMQYTTAVEGRRVAVHCHAGLGRTGLAIACFLVASGQAGSASEAIERVRGARPGSLQTPAQLLFVAIWEQYLAHLHCLFRVADLRHLSLGNSAYVVTRVCRRISRSLSGAHGVAAGGSALQQHALPSNSSTGAADALAAAAVAALGPLASGPLVQSSSLVSSDGNAATATSISSAPTGSAAVAAGEQHADWASAAYDLMTPAEAAAMQQQPSGAAAASSTNGSINNSSSGSGFVVHARRLSGGSSLKLLSNLRAIGEEPAAAASTGGAQGQHQGSSQPDSKAAAAGPVPEVPVHILQTGNAVTEVYGHGLTIIRATDSAKKARAGPPPPIAEQRLKELMSAAAGLGADQQQQQQQQRLPWTERFAIRPEDFQADGWLPEPPASYAEALRRQQRLLHGAERRRCLHLHKVLRAAAKALAASAQAYNAVPPHSDAAQVAGPAEAAPAPASGMRRMHSRSRSNAAAIDLLALAAGGLALGPAGAGGVSSSSSTDGASAHPQQQQQQPEADSAAALLPGIHLGPPGTTEAASSAAAPPEARRMSRSNSARVASGDGGSTACLAGCCAPSFAAGLLIALLYRGRFPEEHEAAWAGCPRLAALGLGEGHAVCDSLRSIKLAANAGRFGPLEAAPGALAVCVLADWFEGLSGAEALSEPTLELLVDEAEALLAHSLAAGAGRQQQQSQAGAQSQVVMAAPAANGSSSGLAASKSRHYSIRLAVSRSSAGGGGDDAACRNAAARGVCASLAACEQDLCLVLAAVLRHARSASLDDTRLQQEQQQGSAKDAQAAADAPAAGSSTTTSSASACRGVVEAQVDAAMAVLYRLVAGWLLGPLALACLPALEGVAAFLHFLTIDDDAYSCLLSASQQAPRKARSVASPGSPRARMQQARMHQQHQQPAASTARLKARLLSASGAGSAGGAAVGRSAAGSPAAQQAAGSGALGRTLSRLLGRAGGSTASSDSSSRAGATRPEEQNRGAAGCGGALATRLQRMLSSSRRRVQQGVPEEPGEARAGAGAQHQPLLDGACSQLVHGGVANDLCVGRGGTGLGAPAGAAPVDAAAGVGPDLPLLAADSPPLPPGGVLSDSPPRCQSPETASPGSRRRLAPLQHLAAPGCSDAGGSSFASSPCSSLGSIASLLLVTPGQQQQQAAGSAHAAALAAPGKQQPHHQQQQQSPLSSTPSNCEVSASSAVLSVSALSDVQLHHQSASEALSSKSFFV